MHMSNRNFFSSDLCSPLANLGFCTGWVKNCTTDVNHCVALDSLNRWQNVVAASALLKISIHLSFCHKHAKDCFVDGSFVGLQMPHRNACSANTAQLPWTHQVQGWGGREVAAPAPGAPASQRCFEGVAVGLGFPGDIPDWAGLD